MNRSGKAVRHWALKENIALENILVLTDELHLPFGTIRLKAKGSPAGHNGLKGHRIPAKHPPLRSTALRHWAGTKSL